MERCREPRIDGMKGVIRDMYDLYRDAGYRCSYIENEPEGSGCGTYEDGCGIDMLEAVTKKFKKVTNELYQGT